MLLHNRGQAIFLSRQPLIILLSKLYIVCPWKCHDHLKPLKHLPINIWSATNTFIWLIPVVTSPKLPLMRSKIYPRWLTSLSVDCRFIVEFSGFRIAVSKGPGLFSTSPDKEISKAAVDVFRKSFIPCSIRNDEVN